MATVTDTRADLEEFVRFLTKMLERKTVRFTVEQSVEEFRLWQAERDRLREEIRPALERSLRGEEGIPWDLAKFKAELDRRLAAKGIPSDGPDQG
ncbi:MAG TPA: hypothetical protein VF170_05350 [Planctomycetaceae bacterium]